MAGWRSAGLLWLTVVTTAVTASAADDAVARAMRLYEKRHYEEAARTLRLELPSLAPARRAAAHLTLGMIYLSSAELHRELHRATTAVQLDYLRKLAGVRGAGGSRFVTLYLGKALLESGNCGDATKYLERFSAQPGVQARDKAIAAAHLGLCHFVRKDVGKARALWADIDGPDPEVQATLAAVYSIAGLKDRDPVAMGDAAMARLGNGHPQSPRLRERLLTVYARAGLTDRGLDLLTRTDPRAVSHAEVLGRTKTINFYDVALLGDLAALYRQASLVHLEKAAADPKLKATADYYLGAAHAEAGNAAASLRATEAFLATAGAPPQYRNRARVRHAAGEYALNRRSEARAAWNELTRAQPADPDLLAEILSQCVRLKADCSATESQAQRVAEAAPGRVAARLHAALGTYYLGKKDDARATLHLEAGRDKGNKNRIEANDPVMLVNLAMAYYRRKQFAESLEIYFEMSKHFPAVRRTQEAIQGVYSIEHQSAGDVKIF